MGDVVTCWRLTYANQNFCRTNNFSKVSSIYIGFSIKSAKTLVPLILGKLKYSCTHHQ